MYFGVRYDPRKRIAQAVKTNGGCVRNKTFVFITLARFLEAWTKNAFGVGDRTITHQKTRAFHVPIIYELAHRDLVPKPSARPTS